MKADRNPDPVPELNEFSPLVPLMAFSEFELVDEQIATSSTDEGALNICPDDERPSDDRATGAD